MGCSTLLFIFFSSINLCFASALKDYKYKCSAQELNYGKFTGSSTYQTNIDRLSTPITSSKEFNYGKFTGGSTYQANIDRLSTLITSSKEFNYGFYNMTVGQRPNKVNAIGLCRADVKQDACKSCLNDTIPQLKQSCPNSLEAVAWSDLCMLRYSSRDIFGANETTPDYSVENYLSVFNIDPFNVILNSLLTNLTNRAAAEGPLRKFAADNTTGPDFFDKMIYAFVQCTPDLSQQQCSNCLMKAISKILYYCDGRIGCRVLQPSCMLRYEVGPFLGPVDDISRPSPPSPPPTEGNGSKKTIIVIVVASILSVVLLVILCILICLRLRKSREKDNAEDEIMKIESLQYDFATIQAATNNFCDENKLGQGGFGAVYKGHLPSGQVVAVKRLSSGSGQGDREFKNEVLVVAKLQHRNLVRLLGFCLEGKERLLIYEFVPNASLDHFIFDPIKNAQLNWEMRYRIIIGIARGLLYLHEDSHLRVVHRDLKPSNVLLDIEMNPKVSDFGMAKLFAVDNQTHDITRRVLGTHGYMAPEYVKHGRFSIKTDVFSFGVMILEIVSGQKNISPYDAKDDVNLIGLAWRNWREGTLQNIVDPNLKEDSTDQMIRCIHIGLLCVQENVLQRPTIGLVAVMLTNNYIILPKPSHLAFLLHERNEMSDKSSSSHEPHQSNNGHFLASNEVTVTELSPR